jgi:cysteine synthase A
MHAGVLIRSKLSLISNLSGNTPLIRITDKIYAKLETYNPAGSVKDRMISYVVRKALIYGKIDENSIFCEATSGNTGIALSMMAAAMNVPCVIFMPKNMSEERRQMMRVYGAKIINAPEDDFTGAINMRNAYLRANKSAWSPKQFENPLNIECHERKTAPEIHKQTLDISGPWSAFIHGSGTGGTIEGVRRYLNKNHMRTKICLVNPSESPHGIQGISDGKDFLFSPQNADRVINISTSDAIERAQDFIKETGILIGISSGANILASERWVEDNKPKGIVVTMLCDRGERYMSIYK